MLAKVVTRRLMFARSRLPVAVISLPLRLSRQPTLTPPQIEKHTPTVSGWQTTCFSTKSKLSNASDLGYRRCEGLVVAKVTDTANGMHDAKAGEVNGEVTAAIRNVLEIDEFCTTDVLKCSDFLDKDKKFVTQPTVSDRSQPRVLRTLDWTMLNVSQQNWKPLRQELGRIPDVLSVHFFVIDVHDQASNYSVFEYDVDIESWNCNGGGDSNDCWMFHP